MKAIRKYLVLALLFPLASCGDPLTFKLASVGLIATAEGLFKDPEINLKEKNFAAADFIASQLRSSNVSYKSPIHILPLEELDNPGITSELGLKLPEGVGLRLIELGYNAQIHDVASGANAGLYQSPPKGVTPHYKMTGRYAVRKKEVDVYLRMIDVKTSRVVAQFDYVMALSKEMGKMSKTKPMLYRVK